MILRRQVRLSLTFNGRRTTELFMTRYAAQRCPCRGTAPGIWARRTGVLLIYHDARLRSQWMISRLSAHTVSPEPYFAPMTGPTSASRALAQVPKFIRAPSEPRKSSADSRDMSHGIRERSSNEQGCSPSTPPQAPALPDRRQDRHESQTRKAHPGARSRRRAVSLRRRLLPRRQCLEAPER